ncbi:MAG: CocE/NonD family hydrolase [Clostridia bacterium]|nr:CocE/NonD family hydrolase [Clostridia bacterium]
MGRTSDVYYLPADGDLLATVAALPEAGGKFPAVIFRTPYQSDHVGMTDGELAAWAAREYAGWLDAGYAVVFQDCRGCGKSTGDSMPIVYERRDSRALYDWVRKQPFYNGEIYLIGRSYTSYVHMASAPFADDVRGAVFEVMDPELYNWHYLNGIYRMNLYGDWQVGQYKKKSGKEKNYTRDSFRLLPLTDYTRTVFGEPIEDYDLILTHPDRSDPFWDTPYGGSGSRDALKNAGFPVLQTTAFFDIFFGGVLKAWRDMDPGTRARSALVIGPYDHADGSDGVPITFPDGSVFGRFPGFERGWMNYARGVGKAPFEPGKVTYYELFSDEGWRSDDLPEPGRSVTFTLGGGERSYIYDPADPTPAKGGLSHNFGGTYFLDPPGSRSDVLTFRTPPFGEDVHAGGNMTARLAVRSDCEDTCFYVRVAIEKKEGDFTLRDDITQVSNFVPRYVPGDVARLDFTFDLCRFVIRRGERLRVDVSSAAFPQFVPHTNFRGLFSKQTKARPATNTVIGDGSTLMVRYY